MSPEVKTSMIGVRETDQLTDIVFKGLDNKALQGYPNRSNSICFRFYSRGHCGCISKFFFLKRTTLEVVNPVRPGPLRMTFTFVPTSFLITVQSTSKVDSLPRLFIWACHHLDTNSVVNISLFLSFTVSIYAYWYALFLGITFVEIEFISKPISRSGCSNGFIFANSRMIRARMIEEI